MKPVPDWKHSELCDTREGRPCGCGVVEIAALEALDAGLPAPAAAPQPADAARVFPIQKAARGYKGAAAPLSIPWSVAEKAYGAYASRYGTDQSLERMAERGGFGVEEMDALYPPWRNEVSEITTLRAALSREREARARADRDYAAHVDQIEEECRVEREAREAAERDRDFFHAESDKNLKSFAAMLLERNDALLALSASRAEVEQLKRERDSALLSAQSEHELAARLERDLAEVRGRLAVGVHALSAAIYAYHQSAVLPAMKETPEGKLIGALHSAVTGMVRLTLVTPGRPS